LTLVSGTVYSPNLTSGGMGDKRGDAQGSPALFPKENNVSKNK
jgi:hypothetical protein